MRPIAVAVPCLNEASTIAVVVEEFRRVLPDATIVVIDNASSDGSAAEARRAGATVVHEPRRGKGFVMQAIRAHVRADVVVVVDGDGTYPADEVPQLLAPVLAGRADIAVGTRMANPSRGAMRPVNHLGNIVISRALNALWRTDFTDVLSGYRVLSGAALSAVPLQLGGFETEVELTSRALAQGLAICEVPVSYRARPSGSRSKLRPFRDGWRILKTLAALMRERGPRPARAPGTSVSAEHRHVDTRVVEHGAAAHVGQRVGHERVAGLAVERASEPQPLRQ